MQQFSTYLTVALEAAKHAAGVIMKYYNDRVEVQIKDDLTPVTQADQEGEQAIIDVIKSYFPKHDFLGEESGQSKGRSSYTWIIDPIDGTKNFVRRIPLFGTQIALMKNDQLILGVSNLPAMQELLYAEKGVGAFLNDTPINVSEVSDLSSAQVSIGGLNHFDQIDQMEGILRVVRATARIRGFGDAYAYHLVASGRIEAVIEAKIRIWDIAALSVIIEAAGGRCSDIQGGAINTDIKTVVASNGKVHDAIVKCLKQC
jgi:histidinol-phosphatase